MTEKIVKKIEQEKIIVILRGIEREKLIPTVQAMYNGGIRLIELTYSANGAVSDEETADRLKMLCDCFGDKMYIGSGTVLTEKQVMLTKQAGGKFIISPNTDVAVIHATKAGGLISIPGALTPSEMVTAHNAGADFVKLFPIANLGEKYVKAVSAPLSHIKILAVGGINENNITDFLKAGACGLGVGANIANLSLINNGEFNKITELAEKYTQAVKIYR